MSKTVHPYAHRLVTLRDWKSHWFADPKKYPLYLASDTRLRAYLEKKLRGMYVSVIEIDRSQKTTRLVIRTSRPGLIIGREGSGVARLREEVLKKSADWGITGSDEFKLEVAEVSNPDADAAVVAYSVVEGLEKRMPYRRVMKQALERTLAAHGVHGARIVLSGRLGGAEIARTEELKRGSIPLQTLRADIDFRTARAVLSYGTIGVKVWINRGKVFAKK